MYRDLFFLLCLVLWKVCFAQIEDYASVAIVIPFTKYDAEKALAAIKGWIHPACSPSFEGRVSLFMYNHLSLEEYPPLDIVSALNPDIGKCFKKIETIYARLKPEEDGYPSGPNNMFFKIWFSKRLPRRLKGHDYVLWVEADTRPIRPYWIDAIVRSAAGGEPFWVRGSHYFGRRLDGSIAYHPEAVSTWIGHINGNALYNIKDPLFAKFLRVVAEREPPNHYWKSFDVSMWKVLNDLPYSWRIYQSFAAKFQKISLIRNINSKDNISALPQECFMVHAESDGNGGSMYHKKFKNGVPILNTTVVYGDEIQPDHKLSIFMRTYKADLKFAALALKSAKTHIPHALEYVAVVPSSDVADAKKILPHYVRIFGEEPFMSDGRVQQKYTKLNADTYTHGRYIMHLDSDVVFYRPVLYKDLFFLGKPIIEYDLYYNLRHFTDLRWQNGTSYALGREVEFEFSRSNDHVYPSSIYKPARQFLENRFNMSLVDFMKTRTGVFDFLHPTVETLFSDFNYLGAFLYYEMHHTMSWTFLGLANDDPLEIAFSALRRPVNCQGNARLATNEAITSSLGGGNQKLVLGTHLKLLDDVASGKTTNCHSIVWHVNHMHAALQKLTN